MKRRSICSIIIIGLAIGFLAERRSRAVTLKTERVASGLSSPLFVTAPPNDSKRLFILEHHTGRIRILDLASGIMNADAFLTVSGITLGDEQGLLGLAFH